MGSQTQGDPARFLILLLVMLTILVIVAQMTEFSSLTKTMVNYYHVSDAVVTMTSDSYLVFYLAFFFPGMIYAEKHGLRHSFVLGTFVCSLGLCLKCLGLKPGRFWLLVISQIFPALGESLITPSIPSLIGSWFKANELATVLALCFSITHCGLGFTFLFQGTLFGKGADVEHGLGVLSIILAVFATAVFILTVTFMKDGPSTPPSKAQALKLQNKANGYSIMKLLGDPNFIYISLAAGIMGSINFVVTINVNQLYLTAFPNQFSGVSLNGILLCTFGIVGSLCLGAAQDRTKWFKFLSVLSFICSILSTALLAVGLYTRCKSLVSASCILFGFFSGGSNTITLDANIELTYPFPETVSTSLIFTLSCAIPIILSPLGATLINTIGPSSTLLIYCLLQLPALWALFRIKWTLKRQNAEESLSLIRAA